MDKAEQEQGERPASDSFDQLLSQTEQRTIRMVENTEGPAPALASVVSIDDDTLIVSIDDDNEL